MRHEIAILDREKSGLNAQIFARVKLSAHGRTHLAEFSKAVQSFPEVLECYVMLGEIDVLLRIVTADVNAYERFFFERLSPPPAYRRSTRPLRCPKSRLRAHCPWPDTSRRLQNGSRGGGRNRNRTPAAPGLSAAPVTLMASEPSSEGDI
ncbi:MAG: Lrp/AsnC ligand binding domain-containing protein [Rhizomicrobium sp.]